MRDIRTLGERDCIVITSKREKKALIKAAKREGIITDAFKRNSSKKCHVMLCNNTLYWNHEFGEVIAKLPLDQFIDVDAWVKQKYATQEFVLQEIAKRIPVVDSEEVIGKLEVGNWYKDISNKYLCYIISCVSEYEFNCYGFDESGVWFNDTCCYLDGVVPATNEEVESALIEEAKRRGYKEGVKVNRDIFNGIISNSVVLGEATHSELWTYFYEHDSLEYFGNTIYRGGKWAEIISQPEPEIDWNIPQLVESTTGYAIIYTTGEHTAEAFSGIGVNIEKYDSPYRTEWIKKSFKPYKGETICIS